MTTPAQLRKAALGLPEVIEGTHFGMVAFSVRGKGFATVTEDGVLQLQVHDDVVQEVLATHPTADRLVRMGTPIGLQIPLADVNGQVLNRLVRTAWASRAPKRLAAALATVDAGDVPAHSDLPSAIGKPATRALLGAGIVTLDDVAARSDEELLALHGVGPKAIRMLRAARPGRPRPG